MNKIDEVFIAVLLILIIGCTILHIAGCVDAKDGKAGVNDNQVTIATTMPVTLYTQADVDAAIKAALQSYEQKNAQNVNAGGNVNQFNFSLAGGGAALFATVIGILAIKYLNALKAFKTVADVVEQNGHAFKSMVKYHAGETGIEKYINKKVTKWYKRHN